MKEIQNKVEYRKLSELKELENNPRIIKKEQFEKLKQSIANNEDYFEARPIILSDRTGELVILAGNQRFKAAKALGLTEVPTVLLTGLSIEREREIVIRDNIENGEWDYDLLANDWDAEDLSEWGLDDVGEFVDTDELIEVASDNTVKEFSEDTNFDLKNLYREKIDNKLHSMIEKGEKSGEIRPEIAEVLKDRAKQCSIFNFDEIIKFYRSNKASELEKELLRRLYLVFVAPKELFEKGMLKIVETTKEIYDDEITKKVGENNDEED